MKEADLPVTEGLFDGLPQLTEDERFEQLADPVWMLWAAGSNVVPEKIS